MHREIFPQWTPPPRVSGLRDGHVDIWRIDLATVAESHPAGSGQRPHGNRTRAHAHNAMHAILSRYLECPVAELQLKVQPGGKPYLHEPRRPLEFNLSHSRDIALLAVTSGAAVGVDVETYREIDDPLRLARRVMSAEECAGLESLQADERLARFLTLWTRMEARQKAIGRGVFAQPADPALLTSFSFRPGPRQWASLSVSPVVTGRELRFLDFSPL